MYQNIILIGNLGRDPEMRYTTAGKAFTSFSLATTEMVWRPDTEPEPMTTWWNVTCCGKTAERVHEKAHKGSRVLVEGRMKPGENGTPNIFIRKDSTPGASYDLTASVVRILDKKVDSDDDDEVVW